MNATTLPPTGQHALMGLASLMTQAFRGSDLSPLGERLIAAIGERPDAGSGPALLDLSILLHLKGSRDVALEIQKQALKFQQCYTLPARGLPDLRLLAIMNPGDLSANMPLEFLVEGSGIELTLLFVAPWLPFPEALPDHDVAIVAIGESQQSRSTLQSLQGLAAIWPRPLLNLPERIASLSRDSVSARLQGIPGLYMPPTLRVPRETLEQITTGRLKLAAAVPSLDYPIIIRPLDSHAGKGLEKIVDATGIAAYLTSTQDGAFFLSRFVDYCSDDGLFRKYRVVLIDGIPYASHMALSQNWIVHYLSGGMEESPNKRCEEQAFMERFDTDFAHRHENALKAIHQRLGLDYLVLDCAETRDGALLLFEADNSAVVHAMDSPELYPYKQPQMRKVFDAFQALLLKARSRWQEQAGT